MLCYIVCTDICNITIHYYFPNNDATCKSSSWSVEPANSANCNNNFRVLPLPYLMLKRFVLILYTFVSYFVLYQSHNLCWNKKNLMQ